MALDYHREKIIYVILKNGSFLIYVAQGTKLDDLSIKIFHWNTLTMTRRSFEVSADRGKQFTELNEAIQKKYTVVLFLPNLIKFPLQMIKRQWMISYRHHCYSCCSDLQTQSKHFASRTFHNARTCNDEQILFCSAQGRNIKKQSKDL